METQPKRTFKIVHSSFGNVIKDQLSAIYDNQDLVDVTLTSKGSFFAAHKVILSLHSAYFLDIFKNSTCKHPTIVLCQVEPKLIDQLLTFIYKGTLTLTEQEMDEFIRLTNMLQINGMLSDNTDSIFDDEQSESLQVENANTYDTMEDRGNETIEKVEESTQNSTENYSIPQILNARSIDCVRRKRLKRGAENCKNVNNKRIYFEDTTDNSQNAIEETSDTKNYLENLGADIIDNTILEPHITIASYRQNESDDFIDPNIKRENQLEYLENFRLSIKNKIELNNGTKQDTLANNNEYENMAVGADTKQHNNLHNTRPKKETLPSDVIEFRKTSTGKLHLLHNSFTFHKNTMRRERVYWLCSAYHSPVQCRARCVTVNGTLFSVTGDHNHNPAYRASKYDTSS